MIYWSVRSVHTFSPIPQRFKLQLLQTISRLLPPGINGSSTPKPTPQEILIERAAREAQRGAPV